MGILVRAKLAASPTNASSSTSSSVGKMESRKQPAARRGRQERAAGGCVRLYVQHSEAVTDL